MSGSNNIRYTVRYVSEEDVVKVHHHIAACLLAAYYSSVINEDYTRCPFLTSLFRESEGFFPGASRTVVATLGRRAFEADPLSLD